ncbi:hypothetical protein B0T09DRAFT_33692 [Sordaria sp. MPI-SDFR-AT-0083]|nr:hypothetical protein B0T09DRAFT_33692 [Sordaria sp. MPI-SDFR-AT-0083]
MRMAGSWLVVWWACVCAWWACAYVCGSSWRKCACAGHLSKEFSWLERAVRRKRDRHRWTTQLLGSFLRGAFDRHPLRPHPKPVPASKKGPAEPYEEFQRQHVKPPQVSS